MYLKSSTSDTNMRFPSWALDFRGLHSGHPRAVFFSAKQGIGRMEGWQGNVHCPLTSGLPAHATKFWVPGTPIPCLSVLEFTCRAFADVFPTSVPKLTIRRYEHLPSLGVAREWSLAGMWGELGFAQSLWEEKRVLSRGCLFLELHVPAQHVKEFESAKFSNSWLLGCCERTFVK